MNIEEFTKTINTFWEECDEKNAALLAGEHPDLYAEYCSEWIGENYDGTVTSHSNCGDS